MEGCERCTLSPSIDGHWSHVSICLGTKVITKRMLILDMQFPFFLSWGKMEDCERCTLSPSIDGHLSHISIILLTKVITKRTLNLEVQFPFLTLGLKWKDVKGVHCTLLLMNSGLISLSSC